MSMDNIQLKQEDMFGEQVVLTDINPVSNTKSIDDPIYGEKLDVTLARIWQAINNKLSRVVNSVNGRTGVVVLTSDDVGLGNVDNVSFADIKSWVIDQIENTFENKRLHMYENYDQVLAVITTNDQAYSWSPYYCSEYGPDDHRAVIGVFTWNTSASQLGEDHRFINTIGYSDNSIIYRTMNTDYNPGEGDSKYSDIPVGGIGVNIYKEPNADDQVLYLESPGGNDKSQAGLRLDHDKLGGRVFYEETPYGSRNAQGILNDDYSGMLWRYDNSNFQGPTVRIYIDGEEIPATAWIGSQDVVQDNFYFNKAWFTDRRIRPNDTIIMRFAQFVREDHGNSDIPNGICRDFNFRQPALGIIKRASEDVYTIRFYTINPNTNGYGITTLSTHLDRDSKSTQLGLDIATSTDTPDGKYEPLFDDPYDVNMSGINANCDVTPVANATDTSTVSKQLGVNVPWGINVGTNNGLCIMGDNSICSYPAYQSIPTSYRLGHAPVWAPNTYFTKENETYILVDTPPVWATNTYYEEAGGSYTLINTEPANWESPDVYGTYYTKNSDNTYSAVVGTIPDDWDVQFFLDEFYTRTANDTNIFVRVYGTVPLYTYRGATNTGYEDININKQICVGSMMSSNFALDETSGFDMTTIRNNQVSQPRGTDPSTGLIGTISHIGVNLRKISSSQYNPNGVISGQTLKSKAGYQFFDMSGLTIHAKYGTGMGNATEHAFTTDFIESIGMPDLRDANGKNMYQSTYPGAITGGLAVNVGKFLEITPKRTYRAETYTDGGKVQVRLGDGLTEQITEIDITDMIKNNAVPVDPRYNFDYTYLQKRYVLHPDEFEYYDGNFDMHIPLGITHSQITSKPLDWDSAWYKYEYNLGTNENPDYVCLPYDASNPIGFSDTDPNYMGPYYERKYVYDLNTLSSGSSSIKNMIDAWDSWDIDKVIWKRPTNRISLNLDEETLSFNEDGKLTVVGGIGEETVNLRFMDSAGYYTDTYHGEKDVRVEPIMVGDGLKLNGGDVYIPDDLRLVNDQYRLKLLDIFAHGLSTYELCLFMIAMQTVFQITVTQPMTISNIEPNRGQIIGMFTNPMDTDTLNAIYAKYHECADSLRTLVSDTTTLKFGEPTYNIPITEYRKDVYRKYMSGSMDDILSRVRNVIRSISSVIPNAADVALITQYFADHYGLGTVTSVDDLVSKARQLPVFNSGQQGTDNYLPLDWAFSFFAKTILLDGRWADIAAGHFDYTEITQRPSNWEPSGYASYFRCEGSAPDEVYYALTPTDVQYLYHPGMFYTYDSGTNTFTIVTVESAAQATILNDYYVKCKYTVTVSEPADWATMWNQYYVTDANGIFSHVNTATAPTWSASTYYTIDANGSVDGYEKVTAAPAFVNDEFGSVMENTILRAPQWNVSKFYFDAETGGNQVTTEPADWATTYASYYVADTVDGARTQVAGLPSIFKGQYAGPYYTRTLSPT